MSVLTVKFQQTRWIGTGSGTIFPGGNTLDCNCHPRAGGVGAASATMATATAPPATAVPTAVTTVAVSPATAVLTTVVAVAAIVAVAPGPPGPKKISRATPQVAAIPVIAGWSYAY